jgi:RNA polymerase sigma-70 factor (ECF subfamily)
MKSFANDTDQVLLRQIGEGEEAAFNVLFERYRNKLYSYLVKISKSRETSEEMVLDAFVKIWTARNVLHEIDNFEAFLFRVAHNRAIDFLRAAERSKHAQNEIWKQMGELVAGAADEKILKADTEKSIQAAIGQLSPQRQEVFRLSREEYLTYDEIAERMELSKFTVRNHLSAALQFIRSHLDNGPELAAIVILLSKNY